MAVEQLGKKKGKLLQYGMKFAVVGLQRIAGQAVEKGRGLGSQIGAAAQQPDAARALLRCGEPSPLQRASPVLSCLKRNAPWPSPDVPGGLLP